VLDHFSLLADGIALHTDQRRAIDRCIKDLKTLCVELNFTMLVVCHLSRGSGVGASHEEGGEPTLAELRGSHSLAQIPDFVVMLVRNPRSDDKVEANTTYAWLKKNRVKGELGLMSKLHYQSNYTFHEIQTF
jgi:twinkle protein